MTFEPTQEFNSLTAEVERRKAKKRAAGMSLEVEQSESVVAPPERPDNIFSVADVMPAMIESMGRQRAKWAAFCESIRPHFDDAPETKACPTHASVRRAKLFEESCQLSREHDAPRIAYAPCSECDTEAARTKRRAFWRKRGVPERVIDATLANFIADSSEKEAARDRVCEWIKRKGNFLVLRGTPGTGKGHLAAGCLRAQGNGLFITHVDMLSDLRASYTLKTTESLLEDWREAELFVLDEFGLSPGGKDEEPMLYQVLASRYDQRRPTVITTNLEREKFREAIGFRLMDRIGEDCTVVVCAWDSYRTKK